MNTDFMCERKLRNEKPEYHELIRNTAFVMHSILDRYTNYFPEYTDHSSSHALQVLDFCNRLIGPEIEKLNVDEIYVLIMSCYLHDTGMGVSEDGYAKFAKKILSEEYRAQHPNEPIKETIRKFHQEFSGKFIAKYAMFFEIPSEEHEKAIIQVSRGHRKSDLYDDAEYPVDMKVPNGNTICLPYLAALIRLADEMDIARDRNVGANYMEHTDNNEWNKHFAIEHLEMTEDAFILYIEKASDVVMEVVNEAAEKLQETLDLCRDVTNTKTKFRITQTKVVLKPIEE